MNQKLVQSLVQIILALSDEEQEYLQSEIGKYSIKKQISELEDKLKIFESKYQMESEYFYQRFQKGELGDSMDFFEWNTYYEMLANTKSTVS
jgi:hypothetical protein